MIKNAHKILKNFGSNNKIAKPWEEKLISPERVLDKVKPGMNIFLSTGAAEPKTLVKSLLNNDNHNCVDLALIQIASFGELISLERLQSNKFRLKTFFSGWLANEAVNSGSVDLIPSYFADIPNLIRSGQIPIDAAFIQITPPNAAGYCSLGVAMDAAREAMEKSSLVVGEINSKIPRTFGDTFVSVSEFDYLVNSKEPPIYFGRWPVEDVFDPIAANIASVIENGACLAFFAGPIFEALVKYLQRKRNLGIHTLFFTDSLMELHQSGAVSNRNKKNFQGRSLTSYAIGGPKLMKWLNSNPLVEFQSPEKVFNPYDIGKNPKFMAIIPCRKADLRGHMALHSGRRNMGDTPSEAVNLTMGAGISPGGLRIFALPSRNLEDESNILLSVDNFGNQFTLEESVDIVVTEYGVASLAGRSVRERAQALIEIAHPDDRPLLMEQAKENNILYKDQIFLAESAHLYQADIATKETFKNGLDIRFRAIKPSDEDEMRRLFYRFSSESVYYRYFTHLKSMPHAKMQEYVNVDYSQALSIVGLVGEAGRGHIIAEARYIKYPDKPWADAAFIVDEKYQGIGIASFMLNMLVRLAKERGLQGFTADVLRSNTAMMKVFEKTGKVKSKMEYGEYHLEIDFSEGASPAK